MKMRYECDAPRGTESETLDIVSYHIHPGSKVATRSRPAGAFSSHFVQIRVHVCAILLNMDLT